MLEVIHTTTLLVDNRVLIGGKEAENSIAVTAVTTQVLFRRGSCLHLSFSTTFSLKTSSPLLATRSPNTLTSTILAACCPCNQLRLCDVHPSLEISFFAPSPCSSALAASSLHLSVLIASPSQPSSHPHRSHTLPNPSSHAQVKSSSTRPAIALVLSRGRGLATPPYAQEVCYGRGRLNPFSQPEVPVSSLTPSVLAVVVSGGPQSFSLVLRGR
jgi:hypothetical protein